MACPDSFTGLTHWPFLLLLPHSLSSIIEDFFDVLNEFSLETETHKWIGFTKRPKNEQDILAEFSKFDNNI